jgi:hypothetical protein
MIQASEEVVANVKKYLDEHLSNKCDTSTLEVYLGGNPKIGDGHFYLVACKNKKPGFDGKEAWSCWTCWDEKVQSLNYGHYDISKEKAIHILMECEPLLDGKEYFIVKDRNEDEEPNIFANEVQLHKFATKMLSNYFEARSDYGNVVQNLMEYVPVSKAEEILNDYNYEVVKGTKEDFKVFLDTYYEKEKEPEF